MGWASAAHRWVTSQPRIPQEWARGDQLAELARREELSFDATGMSRVNFLWNEIEKQNPIIPLMLESAARWRKKWDERPDLHGLHWDDVKLLTAITEASIVQIKEDRKVDAEFRRSGHP